MSDNFLGARGGGGLSFVGRGFALFLGGDFEVEGAGEGFLIAALLYLISAKDQCTHDFFTMKTNIQVKEFKVCLKSQDITWKDHSI